MYLQLTIGHGLDHEWTNESNRYWLSEWVRKKVHFSCGNMFSPNQDQYHIYSYMIFCRKEFVNKKHNDDTYNIGQKRNSFSLNTKRLTFRSFEISRITVAVISSGGTRISWPTDSALAPIGPAAGRIALARALRHVQRRERRERTGRKLFWMEVILTGSAWSSMSTRRKLEFSWLSRVETCDKLPERVDMRSFQPSEQYIC